MAKKYDIIVIGAGPGGYTAALKAAQAGMAVAVIEKEKLGGVCINRGCIPTKALLHAANIFSTLQNCDAFGVSADFISFDFGKMQDYKKKSVSAYRQQIRKLFEDNQVDLIQGTAKLRRGRTVEVHGPDGKDYYKADHVILATGASPITPPIPGAGLPGVMSSDQLLTAASWNYDRLIIVGGGVIGVEFATLFQSLCSKVTLIEKDDHLLGPMDKAVAQQLEGELRKKGIMIYCGARISEITEDGGLSCRLECDGEEFTIRANRILIAAGRKPYMKDLFGEDVTMETLRDGRLRVDGDYMTSEPEVYAIGDLVARSKLAHVAAAQGTYVVEKIAGKAHSIRLEVVPSSMYVSLPIVPSCIYTNPEIAMVGISEETARQAGMKVRCGIYTMKGNGKSIISREESGFIHLIFEAYSNTIVGAQMICPRATDMIGEMATAIANNLTAEQLSRAMRAHPTYSEGIAAAIDNAMGKGRRPLPGGEPER